MAQMKKNIVTSTTRLLPLLVAALAILLTVTAYAATPGITGTTFNLTAQAAYITQPDGRMLYSWGYGCNGAPSGYAPAAITNTFCNTMQIPGPTLIVTEGQPITVNLKNSLPAAAGNTSILFPGLNVTTSCSTATPVGQQGLLTCEAAPGGTVSYTFTPSSPGTRAYYSGTQGDLQVEMGLFGAIIVLPANVPPNCTSSSGLAAQNLAAQTSHSEANFRLAASAYDHPNTCYDREYLFQFSEMDPNIHVQVESQINAGASSLDVATEPYHPAYYMINGRSMPDDMDPNYAPMYPHQPYNGNPHMHPGEQVLLRIIGQGRWQHPFHEHGNHVRILARDGNLILTQDGKGLAGPPFFTTTTTPGLAMDGIFYFTGRGLNWDMYGHNPNSKDASARPACTPDAYGYNTGFSSTDTTYTGPPIATVASAINYYEWCQDHNKPLEVAPFGDIGSGGPATLPDPHILTNGPWYSGSPYLGPDATTRSTGCMGSGALQSNQAGKPGACGTTGVTPPSGTLANPPSTEAGFAFMWHSHNEREITTNNVFPGGMLMMMLVDSREFVIDESN
jgi:FtsP/CotA-like multicopper oxidase with cupredoxin domain